VEKIPVPTRHGQLSTGPEREQIHSVLEFYRLTLLQKCSGLSVDELRSRPLASSSLSLLGLLRHHAGVEQFWFEWVMAGRDPRWYYDDSKDPDVDFNDLMGTDLTTVYQNFLQACEVTDEIAASFSLDDLCRRRPPWRDEDINLRGIYLHLIEEIARHCGHADLLREMIDGQTGY
jgi:Protein of unknown function (DUF664)